MAFVIYGLSAEDWDQFRNPTHVSSMRLSPPGNRFILDSVFVAVTVAFTAHLIYIHTIISSDNIMSSSPFVCLCVCCPSVSESFVKLKVPTDRFRSNSPGRQRREWTD